MLVDEVFGHPNKSMADINHIVILVQYFFMVDGVQSICHFLKSHLFFDFLVHQEYRFVRETLIYLLSPGEQYLGLTPAISAVVAEYVRLTGWTDVLAWNVNTKNADKVMEEKHRVAELPEVIKFLDSLPERLKIPPTAEDPGSSSRPGVLSRSLVRTDSSGLQIPKSGELVGNPYQKTTKPVSKYLEWLSGVLFGKNSRTSQPQPEEIALISNNGSIGQLKNIDMLPLEYFRPGGPVNNLNGLNPPKSLIKQSTSSFGNDTNWDSVADEVNKGSMSPELKPRRPSMFKRAGTTAFQITPANIDVLQKNGKFTTKVMNTISKLKGVAKWSSLSKYISTLASRKREVKSKSNLDELSSKNFADGGEDSLQEVEFLKLHTPGFNLQPARLYPEKVETYNINILQEVRVFKDNFETNMKRERYIIGVFEILRSSIFFVLESIDRNVLSPDPEAIPSPAKNNESPRKSNQFSKRFPNAVQKPEEAWNIKIVKDQFFRSTRLYEECLVSFMVRIEYKALNNMDINSIYSSASIIVKILKNM